MEPFVDVVPKRAINSLNGRAVCIPETVLKKRLERDMSKSNVPTIPVGKKKRKLASSETERWAEHQLAILGSDAKAASARLAASEGEHLFPLDNSLKKMLITSTVPFDLQPVLHAQVSQVFDSDIISLVIREGSTDNSSLFKILQCTRISALLQLPVEWLNVCTDSLARQLFVLMPTKPQKRSQNVDDSVILESLVDVQEAWQKAKACLTLHKQSLDTLILHGESFKPVSQKKTKNKTKNKKTLLMLLLRLDDLYFRLFIFFAAKAYSERDAKGGHENRKKSSNRIKNEQTADRDQPWSAPLFLFTGSSQIPSPSQYFGYLEKHLYAKRKDLSAEIKSAWCTPPFLHPRVRSHLLGPWGVDPAWLAPSSTGPSDNHPPECPRTPWMATSTLTEHISDPNPLLTYFRASWSEAAWLGFQRYSVSELQDARRDWAAKLYAFGIPTQGVVEAVKALNCSVIELGSATGYWACLLRNAGVHVLALDIFPLAAWESHTATEAGTVENLKVPLIAERYPALLLCFPPPDDMAVDALLAFPGDYILYCGEWASGMTASMDFHRRLADTACFELICTVQMPCWAGTSYDFRIFKRRITKTSALLLARQKEIVSAPSLARPLSNSKYTLSLWQCANPRCVSFGENSEGDNYKRPEEGTLRRSGQIQDLIIPM